MSLEVVQSINGVPIRLTDERWWHIESNKPYMAPLRERVLDAVEAPTCILRGYAGALVAVLSLSRRQYLHVVYREMGRDDGFIITAFISDSYNRGQVQWP